MSADHELIGGTLGNRTEAPVSEEGGPTSILSAFAIDGESLPVDRLEAGFLAIAAYYPVEFRTTSYERVE